MHKPKLYAMTCATAATLLLALTAAGTAGADLRAMYPDISNYCDGQGLWAVAVEGGESGRSNGVVFFDIFKQAPPAPSDDDGSEEFAMASQLAAQVELGLGNAGEGDKYHFRFETEAVEPSGATAQGHGFLFVPANTGIATFVIAGKGTHPMGGGTAPPTEGSFKVSGGGDVGCLDAQAVTVNASDVVVEYEDGMTDEGVSVEGVRCPAGTTPGEGCNPPETEGSIEGPSVGTTR